MAVSNVPTCANLQSGRCCTVTPRSPFQFLPDRNLAVTQNRQLGKLPSFLSFPMLLLALCQSPTRLRSGGARKFPADDGRFVLFINFLISNVLGRSFLNFHFVFVTGALLLSPTVYYFLHSLFVCCSCVPFFLHPFFLQPFPPPCVHRLP